MLAHIAVTVLAVVFMIAGPVVDSFGGIDGGGSAGPTPWRVAKIAAGCAIIFLAWAF